MKKNSPHRSLIRTCFGLLLGTMLPVVSVALDLIPDVFQKEKVSATVWELNEQYVRLVAVECKAKPNDHPKVIDPIEVEQALSSLRLWVKGGVFRDEESVNVYPTKQAGMIARYVTDALSKASPEEDVTFNVRGYADVLLSLGLEREWTTGRVFYKDGKLNLIIGEYKKQIDKAKKNVEGSFGVMDDFRDVHFQVGSRNHQGKMPGRIVSTSGVELFEEGRPDWVLIDVAKAALAFRESQTPLAIRKEEQKAKAEAAKLTLERRQMREEMARMRKELKDLQAAGGGASALSLEERLGKLQQLLDKGLITADEFKQRKQAILEEI